MTSPFDGSGKLALVLGARASLPAGTNLTIFSDIAAQLLTLLIINMGVLIRAKLAFAWMREEATVTALRFICLIGHDLITPREKYFMRD
jgi:hypothetical protein